MFQHAYHQALSCLSKSSLSYLQKACFEEPLPLSAAPEFGELEELGLVLQDGLAWKCTPKGVGVLNWWQQLMWADQLGLAPSEIPCPREGENGGRMSQSCQEFRPLFLRSGLCWCGHHYSAHFPALVLSNDLLSAS